MNWRIKGIVQKALSSVPGGIQVNDFLQRTAGGLRDFTHTMDFKVGDWEVIVAHMGEAGISPEGQCLLEVGAGWFPLLPVCFSLSQARKCITVDLSRHMDGHLTFLMLDQLEQYLPRISAASGQSKATVENAYRRMLSCQSLAELLHEARIEYCAPADASRTGLSACSVDVVFSNSVLEHVPQESIVSLMQESRRILRSGGLCVHSANCADHYAYFDRSISFLNYFTFTERDWEFWNNKLQYQNRLRPCDFVYMTEAAGFEIVLEKHIPDPELLRLLPQLQIAPEFQRYPPEQLCSGSADFVGRKP